MSESEELIRLNDILLTRRNAERAEAMKQHGDNLTTIKALLATGDYESARRIGIGLRETILFEDVVCLFKEASESFKCNICGMNNIERLSFTRDTLSWIRSSICDCCAEKKTAMEIEKLNRTFDRFTQKNMGEILEVVGITGRLRGGSFQYDGLTPEIIQACKRSAMGKHGIYFVGGVGSGKSCLSVAVADDVIRTSKYTADMQKQLMRDIRKFGALYRFVLVPSLLEYMRATYRNHDYQGVQRLIEEYSNLQLLILDDIGAEKPSAWVLEKLTSIIDFRNNRELKTLYTSNKTLNELTEHLDERITSRIRQQCEVIQLTGSDRRRL